MGMLLAYDGAGNVVATLDYVVRYTQDEARIPLGLVDFEAHEVAGRPMTEVWVVDNRDAANPVKGSKVWPEWLGGQAHDFRVELAGEPGQKRIGALIHKVSGHRRERGTVDQAIKNRIAATRAEEPVELRDIVGGPQRPVALDVDGLTAVAAVDAVPALDLPLLTVATGAPLPVGLGPDGIAPSPVGDAAPPSGDQDGSIVDAVPGGDVIDGLA